MLKNYSYVKMTDGFKNILETSDRSHLNDRSLYFLTKLSAYYHLISYSYTPLCGTILQANIFVGADHLNKWINF